jgi:hypothetical protein
MFLIAPFFSILQGFKICNFALSLSHVSMKLADSFYNLILTEDTQEPGLYPYLQSRP